MSIVSIRFFLFIFLYGVMQASWQSDFTIGSENSVFNYEVLYSDINNYVPNMEDTDIVSKYFTYTSNNEEKKGIITYHNYFSRFTCANKVEQKNTDCIQFEFAYDDNNSDGALQKKFYVLIDTEVLDSKNPWSVSFNLENESYNWSSAYDQKCFLTCITNTLGDAYTVRVGKRSHSYNLSWNKKKIKGNGLVSTFISYANDVNKVTALLVDEEEFLTLFQAFIQTKSRIGFFSISEMRDLLCNVKKELIPIVKKYKKKLSFELLGFFLSTIEDENVLEKKELLSLINILMSNVDFSAFYLQSSALLPGYTTAKKGAYLMKRRFDIALSLITRFKKQLKDIMYDTIPYYSPYVPILFAVEQEGTIHDNYFLKELSLKKEQIQYFVTIMNQSNIIQKFASRFYRSYQDEIKACLSTLKKSWFCCIECGRSLLDDLIIEDSEESEPTDEFFWLLFFSEEGYPYYNNNIRICNRCSLYDV